MDSILLVGLNMSDLATIGTLSGSPRDDLIACVSSGGGGVTSSVSLVVQLLLLLAGLSSGFVLLESFKLLLNSAMRVSHQPQQVRHDRAYLMPARRSWSALPVGREL